MSHIRAIFRAVALCALICAVCAACLASAIFAIASDEAKLKLRRFIFRRWAKATAALLGIKINAQGRPPRGAFFLVSNHLSYLDIVVFAALTDCVFVAKSEVSRWPVIGFLCRCMNTIFIDREKTPGHNARGHAYRKGACARSGRCALCRRDEHAGRTGSAFQVGIAGTGCQSQFRGFLCRAELSRAGRSIARAPVGLLVGRDDFFEAPVRASSFERDSRQRPFRLVRASGKRIAKCSQASCIAR